MKTDGGDMDGESGGHGGRGGNGAKYGTASPG